MYYESIETNRAKLEKHTESLKAVAKARLERVAAKKKVKRAQKKEAA